MLLVTVTLLSFAVPMLAILLVRLSPLRSA
jgi:hypothetical protein